jgi:kinesin family protein 4/21/27
MGTGFDITVLPQEQGAVPRAVHHIFKGIDRRRDEAISSNLPPPQFELSAQFLELYNEEIIDLFDTTRGSLSASKKLKIHENNDGNIYVDGAITQPVSSEGETLEALKRGALSRSVGSTNMNSQSSRSHAIFTLIVVQRRPVVVSSRNFFVDLFYANIGRFLFIW